MKDHIGKDRSLARGPQAALVGGPAVAPRVERPEIFWLSVLRTEEVEAAHHEGR